MNKNRILAAALAAFLSVPAAANNGVKVTVPATGIGGPAIPTSNLPGGGHDPAGQPSVSIQPGFNGSVISGLPVPDPKAFPARSDARVPVEPALLQSVEPVLPAESAVNEVGVEIRAGIEKLEAPNASVSDAHDGGRRIADALQKTLTHGGSDDAAPRAFSPAPLHGAPADDRSGRPDQRQLAAAKWTTAMSEAAMELKVPLATLHKAVKAAERDMGVPFQSVMDAARFKKYVATDANFRQRYLTAMQELPEIGSGGGDLRPLFARVAQETGVSAADLLKWTQEGGQLALMVDRADNDALEHWLYSVVQRKGFEAESRTLPENAQGEFLRSMAQSIMTKSGKSIEEVSREGAFAYVDFWGRNVSEVSTGRDPDAQGRDVTLYVIKRGNAWKIDFYPGGGRRHTRAGTPSGQEARKLFIQWLKSGVPGVKILGEAEGDLSYARPARLDALAWATA